jgi:hypothetical protein
MRMSLRGGIADEAIYAAEHREILKAGLLPPRDARCRNDVVFILTLFLLFFPLHAFAQGACTEMGCSNGLVLSGGESFDWQPGFYDVRIFADGRTMTCRGKLPLDACADAPTFGCNSPNVEIVESGCALPENKHAIQSVIIKGTPRKVIVSVRRNDRPFLTRTVSARYETVRPNGPGCLPVCRSAEYSLLTTE